MSISPASVEDIPGLLRLINSAYRGEGSKQGWTTEADLLQGEIRIDAPALVEMMARPGAVLHRYTTASNEIEGCVYTQKQGEKLYLGLLTVSPGLQGGGIGRQLLAAAEQEARRQQCSEIFMTVFTVREDLIAWYGRHGYLPTGETRPYNADHRFGVPTQTLEFAVLEKTIALGQP